MAREAIVLLMKVSIPQAVSTVATGYRLQHQDCLLSVSIPQAVSTVATEKKSATIKGNIEFQYRKR